MGKRGPKRIPTVLKVLHGNPGKRPTPVDEPEGVGDLSAPPAYMDEEQRAQWHYALNRAPPGLLTGTDRDIFAAWVNACVEYQKAVLEVRKLGQVVKTGVVTDKNGNTSGGNAIQNPYLSIMNRQAMLMSRFGAELGFSPAARASLGSAAPDFGDGPGTGRRRRAGQSELDRYLALKPDKLN
jgi:P27 family predicted phage terminase small subunit